LAPAGVRLEHAFLTEGRRPFFPKRFLGEGPFKKEPPFPFVKVPSGKDRIFFFARFSSDTISTRSKFAPGSPFCFGSNSLSPVRIDGATWKEATSSFRYSKDVPRKRRRLVAFFPPPRCRPLSGFDRAPFLWFFHLNSAKGEGF